MCPNITEIKPYLTLQTFKSVEGTESKAEVAELDEKSPSVTSVTEHTLYRQKSRSFIGSEKGQEDVKIEDSVQVKHQTFYNTHSWLCSDVVDSPYIYIVMNHQGWASSLRLLLSLIKLSSGLIYQCV